MKITRLPTPGLRLPILSCWLSVFSCRTGSTTRLGTKDFGLRTILQAFLFIILPLSQLHAQEAKLIIPQGFTVDFTTQLSDDEETLITYDGNQIKLWETKTNRLINDFTIPPVGLIFAVRYSKLLKRLYCLGSDGLAGWDLKTGKSFLSIKIPQAQEMVLDEQANVLGIADGAKILFYNATSGIYEQALDMDFFPAGQTYNLFNRVRSDGVSRFFFQFNGKYLYLDTRDKKLLKYELKEGANANLSFIDFKSQQFVLSFRDKKELGCYNLLTGALISSFRFDKYVNEVNRAGKGHLLVTGYDTHIWNTFTGNAKKLEINTYFSRQDGFYNQDLKGNSNYLVAKSRINIDDKTSYWKYRFLNPEDLAVIDSVVLPYSDSRVFFRKLIVGDKYLTDVFSAPREGTLTEIGFPVIADLKSHQDIKINGIINKYSLASIRLNSEMADKDDQPALITAFFNKNEVFTSLPITMSASKKYAITKQGTEQGLLSFDFVDKKPTNIQKLFVVKIPENCFCSITNEHFSPGEKYASFIADSTRYVVDIASKKAILKEKMKDITGLSALSDTYFVYLTRSDLIVLNLNDQQKTRIPYPVHTITNIDLTADHKLIVNSNDKIAIYAMDGKLVNIFDPAKYKGAVASNGKTYLIADNGNVAQIDQQTKKVDRYLSDAKENKNYTSTFDKFNYVLNGNWLVVHTNDSLLRMWNLQSGNLQWKVKLNEPVDKIVTDVKNNKVLLFSYGQNGGIVLEANMFAAAYIYDLEHGQLLLSTREEEANAKQHPPEIIKAIVDEGLKVFTEKGQVKMSVFDFSKKISYNQTANVINASYRSISLLIKITAEIEKKWQGFPGALESQTAKDAPYLIVNMFNHLLIVNLLNNEQHKILDSLSSRILGITESRNRLVAYGSKPLSMANIMMVYDLEAKKNTFNKDLNFLSSGFDKSLSANGDYFMLLNDKLNGHSKQDSIDLIDTKTGQVIWQFHGTLDNNWFTPDNKYILFSNYKRSDSAMVYDLQKRTVKYHNRSILNNLYIGDGWLYNDHVLLNLESDKTLNCGDNLFFYQDKKKLMGFSANNFAEIDPVNGTITTTTVGPRSGFYETILLKGGKYYLSLNGANQLVKWDAATGDPAGFGEVNSTGRLTLHQYSDATLTVTDDQGFGAFYDLKDLALKANFTPSYNESLNLYVPGKYYFVEKADIQKCYFNKNGELYSLDQFDIQYNRPDKVLEAINYPDTALIRSYKKAYEKRIRKLGIDTASFKTGYSVPEADITERDKIVFQQDKESLVLHISGKDAAYKLDRFNVWVNEVPVFGLQGASLKKRNKNVLDTAVTITLSQGENRIETSVTNINGIESYRIPLYVRYQAKQKPTPKTYFIGIGINNFKQTAYNLQYSVKDIRDLTKRLKEKYGDDFVLVDTLFDERVTVEAVTKLKARLKESTVNDRVLIAYSGHGLLSKDFDYYLSTYAINFQDPKDKGLPYDALEDLLDNIPARQKLMLIDACHSGEVDKEELAGLKLTESKRNNEGVTTGSKKGIELEGGKTIGLKNSFDLMRELFVNVGKSTGATVISAAGGMQFALEKGDLQNGVFTYSILEALKQNPTIKVSELKAVVSKRVEELTAGAQQPTSRNENIVVDWNVW